MATAAARPMVNDRREIFGWSMYDWANSAFSTTVITVFLGPYLSGITEAAANADGLVYLFGVPIRFDSYFPYLISASVLLQVTILPILGALADYSRLRKQLLQFFCVLGSIATISLFFVTPGLHWLGGLLFIVANVSFGASIVFYNSYLPNIASEDQRDRVSAFGWAMGYLGGGLLLLINLVLFLFADSLGLEQSMVARISLASAGFWWLGFSTITFATLRQRQAARPLPPGDTYLTIGFRQLAHLMEVPVGVVTVLLLRVPIWLALLPAAGPIAVLILFIARKARTLPEAMKFLVAYLLYNDGI
ncbi:MAG TPA: MFS transporter, partial [Anaerolineae bacterium]|nr:MFS transporter [Anaerolineae bacterium]